MSGGLIWLSYLYLIFMPIKLGGNEPPELHGVHGNRAGLVGGILQRVWGLSSEMVTEPRWYTGGPGRAAAAPCKVLICSLLQTWRLPLACSQGGREVGKLCPWEWLWGGACEEQVSGAGGLGCLCRGWRVPYTWGVAPQDLWLFW